MSFIDDFTAHATTKFMAFVLKYTARNTLLFLYARVYNVHRLIDIIPVYGTRQTIKHVCKNFPPQYRAPKVLLK